MSTNFLYAQAPNRKGNQSKHPAEHKAVSGGTSKLSTPGGQGAPKVADAHGMNNQASMKQPVKLCKPVGYDGAIHNDGYLNSDRKNYLK
jgi:hypothetical protein